MNKRGAEADLGSTLSVIVIIILSLLVIGGAVYMVGQSNKAVFSQAPDDVSAIAAFCKGVADVDAGAAADLLQSPYCNQAREVNYKGFLGFIGGSKQFVNCDFAKVNGWFTPKVGVTAPSCDQQWAYKYCNTLKTTQGVKYKDTVVVNGQTCLSRTVPADPKPVVASNTPPAPIVKEPTNDAEAVKLGFTDLADYRAKGGVKPTD